MSSWHDKDWGWRSWDWDQSSWEWGQPSWYDWDWEDWDWEEDWKKERLDKRQEKEEEQQNTWRTGASDAAPLSKKRNNKGRPAGSGTVSHKRRLHFQQRSYEKRIAREQAEADLKKQQEEEEEKMKEEENKKKKQDDEEKQKRKAEKAEKEKPKMKEEDNREEKATLAQRVAAKKETLDERVVPNQAKGAQEVDISSGDSMSISDDMSSSEDSLDCRDSRDKQKGRGQTPKLEFGPSRLEVVKEEEAARKAAAKKEPQEKASSSSSSSSTEPAAMDTSLGEREEPASKPLDKRELPEIAIDHHNVLEAKGAHLPPEHQVPGEAQADGLQSAPGVFLWRNQMEKSPQ